MRSLLILLLSVIGLTASAQNIKGTVLDAAGKPAMGATISLMKDTGRAVLKFAVVKENGAYSFSDLKAGGYRVSASHVGFQPATSAVFTLGNEDVTVPALTISKGSGDMKTVMVQATKPMVEVKADKTIVNVEGTVNAIGNDALELLRKSPGISIDKDDNLSLMGKNGVQVFIDGKPSPLTGADLANYLKSMQSSNIEAIELITNPSAKYEAAGNAGIINIRLKKNRSLGVNGSVNAGVNFGITPKYNTGFNLNYRNKGVNLFGNYSYNKGTNQSTMSSYRTIPDSAFDQSGKIKVDNESHNFKVGVDFFLNKKSTLGAMVNGTVADPAIRNNSRTRIIHTPTNTVSRVLVANNRSGLKRNNINANLNYMYTGTDGRSLILNADHGNYNNESDQFQPNYYYNATEQLLLSTVIYNMIAPTDINISSLKADYEQNFMKGKLGLGGKISYVETDNDFQRYNVYSNGKALDRDRSNRFGYKENINAGYVNYNRAWKGVMIQAGLRVENTISKGVSTGEKNTNGTYKGYDSSFRRNYTDLFPSAAVTFNKNPMSQISFTFSRRIDRPNYQDLNPFEFKLDEYTFQKGNINLRPQYTNSFGVTHTYKYKLNTTLNYSRVKDMFVQLIDTAETSKAFISKRNLATQDMVSLNVSYPFMYKSYTLITNVNTNYSKYKADFGTGRKVNLDAFGLNLFVQNSLKFAKTWTAELTGIYIAPTIQQGSFKTKAMGGIDLGLQKQVLGGKGTIKASGSDLLRTFKFTGSQDFAGQSSRFSARWESRQFKLNFVYRFGSNQIKAARQRASGAEDESKRTNGGGSGIGIGQ